jgi:flagellar biosynthesis chaperone FliJ
MKFTFRFASLLKIRNHQKREEEQKLGLLFNKKELIEQQINNLEKKCRQPEPSSNKQTVLDNRRYYTQKHEQHEQLIQLRNQHGQLINNLKQQRVKLKEAVKRVRMMEKIKTRDIEIFIDRVEHLEQLQQNEIAIQRYNSDF